MLSHARIIFRKLYGSGSSCGSEPTPSAPAATAESETDNPPPRALYISNWRRSATEQCYHRGQQHMEIIIVNAKGAADGTHLYKLLGREKDFWPEFNIILDDSGTDFVCNGYLYNVYFTLASGLAHYSAMLSLYQHIPLIFTYDASSRESWDEMVTAYESMRSRCKDGIHPFLVIMIAAMGEGDGEFPMSHVEAEAFAAQRDCLFVKGSPTTGCGLCDAVCSLVELAYGACDQYTIDQKDSPQRIKRANAIAALFPARDA
ncbi:uncharacterized protein P174DRAFT_507510 [Aspergillus novofumigatus IBT 16806]|uniref:Uncharacterized protein n=1 Tax=Aspergillus novofumigatus (strain IBT 16806) TaxID=1392255 RepID=A0A2I1BUR3_ASPN1|nr:uncharacterized protein P174DRAFT_507510 [Aspergillus novofumigatus IBT 16806]PKX89140.1 hypothetical protein P174DRAFT_507510 [Aspergillus novofumigatus IBT 16806]